MPAQDGEVKKLEEHIGAPALLPHLLPSELKQSIQQISAIKKFRVGLHHSVYDFNPLRRYNVHVAFPYGIEPRLLLRGESIHDFGQALWTAEQDAESFFLAVIAVRQ